MKISRRELSAVMGLAGAAALVGPGRAFAQGVAKADDLSFVHPELRPVARSLAGLTSGLKFTRQTLPLIRRGEAASLKPFLPDVPVLEKRISVRGGNPDVKIFIVNAKPGASRPAILHTHGGGFIAGTARGSVRDVQSLASELDCVVVTVDYRLAPETSYSGSIEDNYAALTWLHGNAVELGAAPTRIAVMGESAGGGHAALLALTARDRGEVPVLFQMLIYPMLDDRTGSSRPPAKNIGTIAWTPEYNRFGWESFLGQAPGTDSVPVAAVPARVANLAGLPPAFIGVGAIDLFVDEDIEYARRLIDAGVQTELHVIPGAFHGFDSFGATTAVAKTFAATKLAALRRAFAISQ